MDNLVAAIQSRMNLRATDLGGAAPLRLQPAEPFDIASDEQRLGFTLPPLMKRIYTEIGNGGFGPGYGLIGLTNGVPDDTGHTGPEIYESFRKQDPEDANWQWPIGLMPVCHWGCAIYSCVDCTSSNFRMRIFDPNVHTGDGWEDSLFEECDSFEAWMGAWAAGIDLWAQMYGEKGEVAAILSTRKVVSL